MTVPASSVPAVKAALMTKIATQVADSSVLISYDVPGTFQPDDIIVVGDVERTASPVAMIGSGQAGFMHEDYTVQITVSVFRGGDIAQTAFERAYALNDAVETAVRNDMTLGVARVLTAKPTRTLEQSRWDDSHLGRLVSVLTIITVKATL